MKTAPELGDICKFKHRDNKTGAANPLYLDFEEPLIGIQNADLECALYSFRVGSSYLNVRREAIISWRKA